MNISRASAGPDCWVGDWMLVGRLPVSAVVIASTFGGMVV